MATGQTRFIGGIIPKKSAVPGKVPTGTTLGEIFSNLPDRKLWGFDGSNSFEYGSNSYLSLTGGTIIGNTRIIGSLSADTIISGSTNLYSVFQPIGSISANVNGTNTYTGGTFFNQTINVSALTINTLVASGSSQLGTTTASSFSGGTVSGGTFISGGTDLYNIFITTNDGNDITRVQPGTNTYTGGTGNFPTVNISALTINTLVASGSSQLNTTTSVSISGGTVSGGTFISGSTNLNSIFQPLGANSVVGNGTNTYTGGTFFNQTINVSALTINTLVASGSSQLGTTTASSFSGGTVSGGTLFSGSTNIQTIFNLINNQLGTKANLSGATFTGGVTATTFSATTISGGTFISGGTDLYGIFHQKNGYLLQKQGSVTGSTFSGNPKKAIVTFATPFPGSYAIVITGEINRTFTIESKTVSGFTINANANPAFNSSNVYWVAGEIGEGYR